MAETDRPAPPTEEPRTLNQPVPSGGTGRFWRFLHMILLMALVINTALIAVVLVLGAFLVSQLEGTPSSLEILQQAGFLRYYEFVVNEARAGLSDVDIQRLVDRAARSTNPDGRFDTVPNGCGSVQDVLNGIKIPAPKPAD